MRLTEKVVEPDRLDFVDVVTCSHAHTDHCDPDTLKPIVAANPNLVVIVPEAIRELVEDRISVRGKKLQVLDDFKSITVGEFRVTGVASAHEGIERDVEGRCLYLGYIIELGPWTIYHSGDTILYDALVSKLQRFDIDLALLPINGRAPERGVPGNLTAGEAAWLGHEIHARTVIPCHYGMFEFNTADPEDFARAARALGQHYLILPCGERFESQQLGP